MYHTRPSDSRSNWMLHPLYEKKTVSCLSILVSTLCNYVFKSIANFYLMLDTTQFDR